MALLNQIRDALTPNDNKAREQLDILKKAAEGQLEKYKSDLVAKIRTPEAFKEEIVPNKMFQHFDDYRVSITEGAADEMKKIVDTFFSGADGSVKDGFKDLIKLGLNAILGSTQIGESRTSNWYVMVEFGAIIRTDVMAWRYNFTGQGLIDKIQNAFCYTVTKSFVDETQLSPMQVRYFIAKSLGLKDISDIDKNQVIAHYVELLDKYRRPMRPLNALAKDFAAHYNRAHVYA